jgi:hypothetical protein
MGRCGAPRATVIELLPLDPQVRTNTDGPGNLTLCANKRLLHRSKQGLWNLAELVAALTHALIKLVESFQCRLKASLAECRH